MAVVRYSYFIAPIHIASGKAAKERAAAEGAPR